MALAPRIDAPPDLVDDSDDDERPVVLAGAAMWPSLFQDSDNDLGARSPIRVGHRNDRDALPPFIGRSLVGLRAFEARILLQPQISLDVLSVSRTASHITVGEIMPDLIESSDDEMPALVADDPSFRGTCRSPAWGCAKPGRQG